MRYTGPKVRLCRREGINLFGAEKYQKMLQRRPGIPGMHGNKRTGKVTEYGRQLREKQKAKRIFGLSEKQFKKYFDQAVRSSGVTGDMLFHFMERRLDNVLFRAGFALTRSQARQFASHGLFCVNGRRVDVPSIQVKTGDVIQIKPSKEGLSIFKSNKESMTDYVPPSWLNVNPNKLEITILELPTPQYFDQAIESRLIVEFYSR